MGTIKKSQTYPNSIIKVGAVLYYVLAWVNESGKAEVELQEWIVRSIKRRRGSQTKNGFTTFSSDTEYSQRKYVNITHKEKGVTWGKRSRKRFDFGWLNRIPTSHRKQFAVGDNLPPGIYTTKLAAYQYAASDAKDSIQWLEDSIKSASANEKDDYLIELDEYRKEYAAIERRLKRLRSCKSKAA